MELVIAISGLHGTGKSVYARNIAKEFRLRYISAGELFRKIAMERKLSLAELSLEATKDDEIDRLLDKRTREEIKKGKIVIEGLLAGWMAMEHTALKIYLKAPNEIRISRIASRDSTSYTDAEKATLFREQNERKRFKRIYDIDIDNLTIYDLVLNTALMSIESNIKIIKSMIKEYLKFV